MVPYDPFSAPVVLTAPFAISIGWTVAILPCHATSYNHFETSVGLMGMESESDAASTAHPAASSTAGLTLDRVTVRTFGASSTFCLYTSAYSSFRNSMPIALALAPLCEHLCTNANRTTMPPSVYSRVVEVCVSSSICVMYNDGVTLIVPCCLGGREGLVSDSVCTLFPRTLCYLVSVSSCYV